MKVVFRPHAQERMRERGATKKEVILTAATGEQFQSKFGWIGFRRNFPYAGASTTTRYRMKQVEAYGIKGRGNFIVITVIVKYF